MGEERESGGAGARACGTAQRRSRRPSPAARPGTSAAPRARYRQRPAARPPWPRRTAALPPPPSRAPRGAGAAPQPHRELFLLLGSTPLKVVVVVMVPKSEVGWSGSRALKGSGPRGAEVLPTRPPATAAGASATACFTGRSLYKARKTPAPTLPVLANSNSFFVPIGSLECQASCGHLDGLRWPQLSLNPPPSWSG